MLSLASYIIKYQFLSLLSLSLVCFVFGFFIFVTFVCKTKIQNLIRVLELVYVKRRWWKVCYSTINNSNSNSNKLWKRTCLIWHLQYLVKQPVFLQAIELKLPPTIHHLKLRQLRGRETNQATQVFGCLFVFFLN